MIPLISKSLKKDSYQPITVGIVSELFMKHNITHSNEVNPALSLSLRFISRFILSKSLSQQLCG